MNGRMLTPLEIEKMIAPKGSGVNINRPKGIKTEAVIVLLLVALVLIGAGIYSLIKFKPSLSQKIITNIKIQNKDGYLLYQPASFADSAIKRLVLVIQPGATEQEARDIMNQWSSVAKQNGYLVAGMPDWSGDSIISFLKNARSTESVSKVYVSGFSNGGYNSCSAGLALPQVVDGIIPMGAYCSSSEATLAGSTSIPILTVIGSQDTWALGDDGQLAYTASQGLPVEWLIVPNIGHVFPASAMAKVADWINRH